jgi:hypothetical protein
MGDYKEKYKKEEVFLAKMSPSVEVFTQVYNLLYPENTRPIGGLKRMYSFVHQKNHRDGKSEKYLPQFENWAERKKVILQEE